MHSDVPASIPLPWQIWLEDKNVRVPPHPRMVAALEDYQDHLMHHVGRNRARVQQLQDKMEPGGGSNSSSNAGGGPNEDEDGLQLSKGRSAPGGVSFAQRIAEERAFKDDDVAATRRRP